MQRLSDISRMQKRAGLTIKPIDWPRVRKVLQRVFGCESHWGSDIVSSDEIMQGCTHLYSVVMDQDLEAVLIQCFRGVSVALWQARANLK